jgi:hypothetical protein
MGSTALETWSLGELTSLLPGSMSIRSIGSINVYVYVGLIIQESGSILWRLVLVVVPSMWLLPYLDMEKVFS